MSRKISNATPRSHAHPVCRESTLSKSYPHPIEPAERQGSSGGLVPTNALLGSGKKRLCAVCRPTGNPFYRERQLSQKPTSGPE